MGLVGVIENEGVRGCNASIALLLDMVCAINPASCFRACSRQIGLNEDTDGFNGKTN